jgi:hypothetical protein
MQLYRQVRNILDWGKDTRLKQIGDALDTIFEENRKKAAERAKTRQPPSDGSVTGSGKKPKSSSSRRNSSKANSVQDKIEVSILTVIPLTPPTTVFPPLPK